MNFAKVTQWKTLPQCKGGPTLRMSAWMNLRNTVLNEGRKSQKRKRNYEIEYSNLKIPRPVSELREL